MPSLRETQRRFAADLLGGGGPSRMAVYRANAFGNWSAALAGAYPIARMIVGEDFFVAVAHDYARGHPSSSGDLHEYGEHLPGFLEAYGPVRDLPYLPDVARMEWLAHRAYYAADPAPFDLSRPTEVRLAPCCGLLASAWPLASIWEAHQAGGDPSSVNLAAGPCRILVHREGWQIRVRPLARDGYRFLERLSAGSPLGEALEAASSDPAFDARIALATWVEKGVIAQ
jgi:uncharacterized protein